MRPLRRAEDRRPVDMPAVDFARLVLLVFFLGSTYARMDHMHSRRRVRAAYLPAAEVRQTVFAFSVSAMSHCRSFAVCVCLCVNFVNLFRSVPANTFSPSLPLPLALSHSLSLSLSLALSLALSPIAHLVC
jgi:hypothetical protein